MFAVITLKFKQRGLICPKFVSGMTNSVDPDQTVPLGISVHHYNTNDIMNIVQY